MSWIRSDENLPRHPKTLRLKHLLGVELDTVIGRLHFLWWWCLQYALDGDLRKHDPQTVADACKIPFESLCEAGFVDARPYRRIHDWWDNQGNYLKLRFKDQPDKWNKIKTLYERRSKHRSTPTSKHQSEPKCIPVDVDLHTDVRTSHTDVRTDVKKFTRARAPLAGSGPSAPPAPPPRVKIDNDEPKKEQSHDDFLKLSHISSDKPRNEFDWSHLERKMDNIERVQSKMREKLYRDRKWN